MPTKTPTKDTRILVLYETAWQSIVTDVVTFTCVGLLAWFNHAYLGGSWVIDAFSVFAVITMLTKNHSGHYRCTIEELRQWARQ